ncbi:MAG: RagB/SusD family nutrient uptake outer membrane protein [Tannerellaceae bacterium]|nr:RagB/SusD family nutrient uptake outer membrane protein [Tannerellaceae bacterium]
MKKITQYSLLLLSAITISGCIPNMDLNNPEEISVETYYKTAAQLETAVIPAYQALIGKGQGTYSRCGYFNMLAPGDDFDNTFKWPDMYQSTYNTPASNGEITAGWKDHFNGVHAANTAIEAILNFEGEITASHKDRLLGEAYFLRALHYMHLGMMYGETVPLIEKPVKESADYFPANAEPGKVYELIINDFAKAADLLPLRSELYANPADRGRATKGAAQAYLAKAYMYRPILELGKEAEFEKAAAELKKVIDSREYELMDNFRANSLGGLKSEFENNKESLFELQMVNGPSWLGDDQSCSWRWQEIGVPDGTGDSWWNLAPNQKTYNEFEPGDPRKFMTLWCPDGAHFTQLDGSVVDWNYMLANLPSDKHLFGTRKYCPDEQIGDIDDDINDRLLRYADVLLLYAECLSETGNDAKAITDPTGPKYYIQMVRDRANNIVPTEQPHLWYQSSPGTLPDVDRLLAQNVTINDIPMNSIKNIIQHERYVELCGEYQRYFDLLRWGMADSKWLGLLEAKGWTRKAMYYPFPQEELDYNKNLKGNSMN